MPHWEQRFDFYQTSHDGARVIVYLDLAAARHAPVATHSIRLDLRVKMLQPRSDGLRSNEEFRTLCALEDGLARELETQLHAIYVGRLISGGYVDFIFYAPESQIEPAGTPLAGLDASPYVIEALLEPDEGWEKYGAMYPDSSAMRSISNRNVVDAMTKRGDHLEVEREVDHLVYFSSEEKAQAAGGALAAVGFRVDPVRPPMEPGEPWALAFHRNERCDGDHPDRFVFEVLDLVVPLDGDYDGWGCEVQRRPGN